MAEDLRAAPPLSGPHALRQRGSTGRDGFRVTTLALVDVGDPPAHGHDGVAVTVADGVGSDLLEDRYGRLRVTGQPCPNCLTGANTAQERTQTQAPRDLAGLGHVAVRDLELSDDARRGADANHDPCRL